MNLNRARGVELTGMERRSPLPKTAPPADFLRAPGSFAAARRTGSSGNDYGYLTFVAAGY